MGVEQVAHLGQTGPLVPPVVVAERHVRSRHPTHADIARRGADVAGQPDHPYPGGFNDIRRPVRRGVVDDDQWQPQFRQPPEDVVDTVRAVVRQQHDAEPFVEWAPRCPVFDLVCHVILPSSETIASCCPPARRPCFPSAAAIQTVPQSIAGGERARQPREPVGLAIRARRADSRHATAGGVER